MEDILFVPYVDQVFDFRNMHRLKSFDEEPKLSREGTLCRELAKQHSTPRAVNAGTGLQGAHFPSAVSGAGISAHHLQNHLLAAALTQERVL